MYRKKDKSKKRIITAIICIIVILLLMLSFKLNRHTFFGEGIIKDTLTIIEKVVTYPFLSIRSTKVADESKSYIIESNRNKDLEKEIEELKGELKLRNTMTSFDTVTATILNRNKSYYFNTINIDKGTFDGIKEDMIAITSKGLIGKVSKVSRFSSEIKLITSDDINYKISVDVKTEKGDFYAILNGYDEKQDLVIVEGLDPTSKVKIGDTVTTSGLGSVPRGINIGKVEVITQDRYNLSKTIYIKTGQDFNSIHYVTILKEKSS